MGYSQYGHKESDVTEATSHTATLGKGGMTSLSFSSSALAAELGVVVAVVASAVCSGLGRGERGRRQTPGGTLDS